MIIRGWASEMGSLRYFRAGTVLYGFGAYRVGFDETSLVRHRRKAAFLEYEAPVGFEIYLCKNARSWLP